MSSKTVCALAIVMLFGGIGCDDDEAPRPKPVPAPSPTTVGVSAAPLLAPPDPVDVPSSPAVWRVGDEELAIGSTAIRRIDERTYALRVATDGLGCEGFAAGKNDEKASFIELVVGLDARSTAKQHAWHVSSVVGRLAIEGSVKPFDLGLYGFGGVTLSSTSTVAGTELEVGMSTRVDKLDMTLEGALKAKGCGEENTGDDAGATMRLANQRYRLRGGAAYLLDGSDTVYVVLGTRAPACEALFPDADLTVTLSVPKGSKKVSAVGLGGSALARDANETLAEGTPNELAFDGSLEEASGSVKVKLPALRGKSSALPFVLGGTLDVLRCGQRD